MTVSPIDAAQRLHGAAVDGRLEALAIGPVRWRVSMRWFPATRCTSTDRVSSRGSR
ncbi:MAG: hypothetical protein ACRDXB_21605 [Actinomycetes bacterium]